MASSVDKGPFNGLYVVDNYVLYKSHEQECRNELAKKDTKLIQRDVGFHNVKHNFVQIPPMQYTSDSIIKVCKHCTLFTQDRKRCSCNLSMYNLKYSKTGHWDTATHTDESCTKIPECMKKRKCMDYSENRGWPAVQMVFSEKKRHSIEMRRTRRRAYAFLMGMNVDIKRDVISG